MNDTGHPIVACRCYSFGGLRSSIEQVRDIFELLYKPAHIIEFCDGHSQKRSSLLRQLMHLIKGAQFRGRSASRNIGARGGRKRLS